MRVRNGDSPDAAQAIHGRNRRLVNQADAVPQQVALRRLHQQRPLPDGKAGLRANAGQPWFFRFDDIVMISLQISQCRPLLPLPAHVLPLILADGAVRRCTLGGGELRTAGLTYKMGHDMAS